MKTYFVVGREENFLYTDPNTGETLDFNEVLKADFLKSDDTPTECSASDLSISLDDFSEDEESVAECMTPKGKDNPTAKGTPSKTLPEAVLTKPGGESVDESNAKKPVDEARTTETADAKSQSKVEAQPDSKTLPDQSGTKLTSGEDSKSETEAKTKSDPRKDEATMARRGSRKSSTSGKEKTKSTPINLNRVRKLGLNDIPDTTKVLNEAARRLNQDKMNTTGKPGNTRRQDVTFASEKPSEIPRDQFESDATEESNSGIKNSRDRSKTVENDKNPTDGISSMKGQQINKSQLIVAGSASKPSSNGVVPNGTSSVNPVVTKRRNSDTRRGPPTDTNSKMANGSTRKWFLVSNYKLLSSTYQRL